MYQRIRGPTPGPTGPIQAPKVPENEPIVFSFNFFQPEHLRCNAQQRDGHYFRALLDRLKVVGQLKVKQFRTMHAARNPQALRIHPIDWNHPKIIQSGFGIPHRQDLDQQAWQFSLSKHQNGRVHGFLIDTVFHIVWLDPDHNLYPWEPK